MDKSLGRLPSPGLSLCFALSGSRFARPPLPGLPGGEGSCPKNVVKKNKNLQLCYTERKQKRHRKNWSFASCVSFFALLVFRSLISRSHRHAVHQNHHLETARELPAAITTKRLEKLDEIDPTATDRPQRDSIQPPILTIGQ
jgi:hypothetical protein